MSEDKTYFCAEPWTGLFSFSHELDAVFCPCYLKMKVGNLREKSLVELWNSDSLVALRESFAKGELPAICRPQLCPVALGTENHKVG
jgi:hypothetical protein